AAAAAEANAETWAEGSDGAVALLGGEHSSKGWAGVAETHKDAAEAAQAGAEAAQAAAETAEANAETAEANAEAAAAAAEGHADRAEGVVDDLVDGTAAPTVLRVGTAALTRVPSVVTLYNPADAVHASDRVGFGMKLGVKGAGGDGRPWNELT